MRDVASKAKLEAKKFAMVAEWKKEGHPVIGSKVY